MKTKIHRIILVLIFPVVVLAALAGCQDSSKDGTSAATNAPAKP